MSNGNLSFSFPMGGVDRQAILEEAARELDALRGHLGTSGGAQPATPQAAAVRELKLDEARLAAYPDIYRITDQDFLTRKRDVPVPFSTLAANHNFYWIRLPVGLAPRRNWAFNLLEVRIEFNRGDAAQTRPRAYQILPSKNFQTLLQVNDHIEISLDEKFEFAASTSPLKGRLGPGQGSMEIGAGAVASAGLGVVAGPFTYRLKRAKIDHNSTGLEWVFWRLDGAEFFQEDTPELIVIAQVPKTAARLELFAELQACRYFNFAAADLQEAVKHLASRLRELFKAGLPVYDAQQYDLTPAL